MLIMIIGPPASGKTHLARCLFQQMSAGTLGPKRHCAMALAQTAAGEFELSFQHGQLRDTHSIVDCQTPADAIAAIKLLSGD